MIGMRAAFLLVLPLFAVSALAQIPKGTIHTVGRNTIGCADQLTTLTARDKYAGIDPPPGWENDLRAQGCQAVGPDLHWRPAMLENGFAHLQLVGSGPGGLALWFAIPDLTWDAHEYVPPATPASGRTPNVAPGAWASASEPDKTLLRQEDALNEKCQDGSGNDAATQKSCTARDHAVQTLEAHGWHYGTPDQIEADKQWARG